MKKFLSVVLCVFMIVSTAVYADGYDILFDTVKSGSMEMKIDFKCENLDFINELDLEADLGSPVDGKLFFEGVLETEADCSAEFTINDDYTDMAAQAQIAVNLPFRLNNNLIIDARVKFALWADIDITDENNPVAKLVLSTPLSTKYICLDAVKEMSLSGLSKSAITAQIKEYVNKENIDKYKLKFKTVFKENTTLTESDDKLVFSISNEQFYKLIKETLTILTEDIDDEASGMGNDLIDVFYSEIADSLQIDTVSEIELDSEGLPQTSNNKTTLNIKYEDEYDETIKFDIGFEINEITSYSNINQPVEITIPELTDQNSLDLSTMYDMDYGYDYIWVECDAIASVDDSFYVPLGTILTGLRNNKHHYCVTNDNGVITVSDESDGEAFDTLKITVGSNEYEIDSQQYTALNPAVLREDGVYVDNGVVQNAFGLKIERAETNLLDGKTDAAFSREEESEEYDDYYDDSQTYYDEYDDTLYSCDHYQNLWLKMDYPDIECNDYFSVRSVIDNYMYANAPYCVYDISYDNGVVTISLISGEDNLRSAVITVGSSVVYVNGTEYACTLAAVNEGGRVYVDKKAIEALFGFELKQVNLVYEISDDNDSVVDTFKSADFERKNPLCTHKDEEVYFFSDFN